MNETPYNSFHCHSEQCSLWCFSSLNAPLLIFFEGSSPSTFHINVAINLVHYSRNRSSLMGVDILQHSVLGPQVFHDAVHASSLTLPPCSCCLCTCARQSFISLGNTSWVALCARTVLPWVTQCSRWGAEITELCLLITWLLVCKAEWRSWRQIHRQCIILWDGRTNYWGSR